MVGVTVGDPVAPGLLEVFAGGSASGVTVADGVLQVNAGGSVTGAVVRSGGREVVETAADADGVTVSSGGMVEIRLSGALQGAILAPGAEIDLDGVAATSAYVDGQGKLVAASDGAVVATIGLAAAAGGLGFVTSSDGLGGTDILVTSVPVADDFAGTERSYLLIQNTAGAVVVGQVVNGQAAYAQVAGLGPEWRFVGNGDFLGDGRSEFLIENTAGAVVAGTVSNGQVRYAQVAALGSEWSFRG